MGHDEPTIPTTDRSRTARARLSWQRLPFIWALAVLVAVMGLALLPARDALAERITVTTDVDENLDGGGAGCSLREAIVAANTVSDYNGCIRDVPASAIDEIVFQIPPSGQKMIVVDQTNLGNLPQISVSLTINGRSQGGAIGDPPLIAAVSSELPITSSDPGFPSTIGLDILGSTGTEVITVIALAIGQFDVGVYISDGDGVFVYGNYVRAGRHDGRP
ncbi:MAG TPA: CSLREA domain-containing protein [Chloroflexota bacterium]|nr:CSLREA domain-containing protein [Chloroflexota bacterium]